MNFELMFETIVSRYSGFPASYSGEELPDEVVSKFLAAAHSAPNHAKTQPWRFFVFSGKGKSSFAQMQAQYYQSRTPADRFSESKHQKLLENPLKASHIIAIGAQFSASIPEIEEVMAVACAVQNLALCVHAYGATGYWSTGGFTYAPDAASWFGMPENSTILGFFYIGVPKEPLKPTWDRGNIEQKVQWINQ